MQQRAYVLGDVIVDGDGAHIVPVVVLGEDVGENDDCEERHEQTEAAASQGGANLLEGGGVQGLVLQVGNCEPGCNAGELAGKRGCIKHNRAQPGC